MNRGIYVNLELNRLGTGKDRTADPEAITLRLQCFQAGSSHKSANAAQLGFSPSISALIPVCKSFDIDEDHRENCATCRI